MLKLLFAGVEPTEVRKDTFPGKMPPTAAPPLPHRPKPEANSTQKDNIGASYRRFKKRYPKGYVAKRETFEWHNDKSHEDL